MLRAYRKLPVLARIGIPTALVLVAVAVTLIVAAKQATDPVVVRTQDPAVYDAAQKILDSADVAFDAKQDSARNSYVISVRTDLLEDASQALVATGISGLPRTIKPFECPAPPGFTATKAANENADNCEDAKSIQSMLITARASAALVHVSQKADTARPDRGSRKLVLAQVYLPSDLAGTWPADEMARAIATALGISVENVTITDDESRTLFDGSDTSAARAKR